MTHMKIKLDLVLTAALALAPTVGLSAPAPTPALPPGAVVAFTPATVCESLAGGWKDYADAAGRVIVGAAPGLPAASAAPPADYWTRGVTLKPENLPRSPVTGSGQIVVTTPEVLARADEAKHIFGNAKPNLRLFGYPTPPAKPEASETLAVGYGAAGATGRDTPDAVAVAPPYVALRYCVKL